MLFLSKIRHYCKAEQSRKECQTVKSKVKSDGRRALLTIFFLGVLFSLITLIPLFASAAEESENYIYFDLAAGNVTITASTYTGYIFETTDGTTQTKTITGSHSAGNKYYVYQSTKSNKASTGVVDGVFKLPQYERVSYDGKAWGEYITNNTATAEVAKNWTSSAQAVNRTETDYYVSISGKGKYDITIDNLWSKKNEKNTSRVTGGIACTPSSGSITTIRLKGDTRFGNIHYFYNTNNPDDQTRIEFVNGEKTGAPGSMTVVSYNGKENHYNSVIGGNDSGQGHSCGIWFSGGIIYAGARWDNKYNGEGTIDNCTAIGGGGNDTGVIKISGGTVTAVTQTTGTAIGGGIGYSQKGGKGIVTITGGEVYAYNFGYLVGSYPVPASAIGGAGSNASSGTDGTVKISGGKVYAQSVGGAAIGGGSSVTQFGGGATVEISGDAQVEALSTEGYVRGVKAFAGVSIGGGTAGPNGTTAYNGGNATISISGGVLKTGSIGGGDCLNTEGGKIGKAEVYISGGTLQGQVIMAGGATEACIFEMTNGRLDNSTKTDAFHFVKSEYGAVYMDDTKGECTISGGSIINSNAATKGGAVYMTAGKFTLSNTGEIRNCTAEETGGAVYLGGGVAYMNGGTITSCSSDLGGAIAVNGGNAYVNGGLITGCTAASGGALYVSEGDVHMTGGVLTNNAAENDGGAIYVNNGNVTMQGGAISGNTARLGSGGGMMVTSDESTTIIVTSGEISSNSSNADGGAIAVTGGMNGEIIVHIGIDEKHFDENDQFVGCDHTNDGELDDLCPILNNNITKGSGGAIYVHGQDNTSTRLEIYCIVESGNRGGGYPAGSQYTTTSDFMKVEGGAVSVISSHDNVDASVATNGYNTIHDSIHITGGQLNISGSMCNPKILAPITVDVTESGGGYDDTRINSDKAQKKFKVRYYENFRKAGASDATGQYTSYDISEGESYVIRPVMYDHPGYSIAEWNILDSPTDEVPGYKYAVNSTVVFSRENIDGGKIPGLDTEKAEFVLYAIWDFNSYYVNFKANVPEGNSYEGTMKSITLSCTDTSTQYLPKNSFVYEHYLFLGWSLDKENVILLDKANITQPLTTQNGTIVTLYAVWCICPHENVTVNEIHYSVVPDATVSGDTLTQTCSCGASRNVTLIVHNSVYNKTANEATLSYSVGYWGWEALPITYSPAKNETQELTDGKAVNAGVYDAAITVGGKDLTLSFTIAKAPQSAPSEIPTFIIRDSKEMLEINPIGNEPNSGTAAMYRLAHYAGDAEIVTDWSSNRSFYFDAKWTTYYVAVYYPETENYLESEIVNSEMTYIYAPGSLEVLIKIVAGSGIKCFPGDYKDGETLIGVMITVKVADGYYLPTTFTATQNSTATFTKQDDLHYVLTNIPNNIDQITVTFSDAYRTPVFTIGAAEGESFGEMSSPKSNVTVSGDSAFTVGFGAKYYEHYNKLRIVLDKALPLGTTLILKDMRDGSYWYYRVTTENKKEIRFEEFTKMGGSGNPSITETVKYQVIFDFSKTTGNTLGSLSASLTADGEDPNAPVVNVSQVSVSFDKVNFSLNVSESDGLTVKLDTSFAFNASGLSSSKWDIKSPVLVLKPIDNSQILGDMSLTVEEIINSVTSTSTYLINGDGAFIIPLNKNANTITLNLNSNEFPDGTTLYQFTAELYASECPAPLINDEAVTDPVNITFNSTVSAKNTAIDVSANKEWYSTTETVSVTINGQNAEGYDYTATLMKKGKNGYVSTGYDESGTFENNDSEISFQIVLGGRYAMGNYSVKLVLYDEDGFVVSETYCYFIIHEYR